VALAGSVLAWCICTVVPFFAMKLAPFLGKKRKNDSAYIRADP
jgi:uncharacterized membrane protein YraQ (UPF0718 family)